MKILSPSLIIILISFLFSPFASASTPKFELTPGEAAYLKEHPVITVSNDMNYPPLDFKMNGKPSGLSIDLLNLLAKETGFKIKYINGFKWDELISMFKRGEIDLMNSLYKNAEREKIGVFSNSFWEQRSVFIMHKDTPGIQSLSKLKGKRVSVVEGWAIHKFLSTHYPDIEIVPGLVKD
jgi:ABC-type amino acid transport substrate-binding protein